MNRMDVGNHGDLRLSDRREERKLAESIRSAHLEDRRFSARLDLEHAKRKPDLAVEVAGAPVGGERLTKNRGNDLLGARLADAARDPDDGQVH